MLRAQKYGLVEMQDRDDIHRDLSTPPRPCSFAGDTAPSYAFPPRQISTADGLQRALDDHPPPPELHTATVWLIRTFPILATVSWLGTLISLFFLWLFSDHKQRYPPSLGGMPYLSDVGARHKTVFFVGNTCTAVCFVVTLFEERLLRARRVMVEATEEKHLWVSIGVLDVFLGLVAGISLVLLAVFDPTGWEKEHCVLFTIFVTCITLSGLLQTLEVEHLWHEHPDRHDLRDGTILKWSFLLFSSACGIAFAILYATCDGDATTEPFEQCYRITTAAALLQWSSALGLSLYFSTLILDLWPLHRHHPSPTPVVWADKTGVRGRVGTSFHAFRAQATRTQGEK
ncbi:hypothetical protein JCM11251_005377 [Rhodosporidiobolus azoricus]